MVQPCEVFKYLDNNRFVDYTPLQKQVSIVNEGYCLEINTQVLKFH